MPSLRPVAVVPSAAPGRPALAVVAGLERATPVCSPYLPQGRLLFDVGPEVEQPAYLVALYGDESLEHPGKNQGLQTAEVALVGKDGSLGAWVLQDEAIVGNYRHGNDGLLYHDFAFSFLGVLVENLGSDPQSGQIWNNVYRYQVDAAVADTWTEPPPATLLYDLNPAASYMVVPRAYLSVVRLNAFIFGIAGNAGSGLGPVSSIERIKQ